MKSTPAPHPEVHEFSSCEGSLVCDERLNSLVRLLARQAADEAFSNIGETHHAAETNEK